MAADPRRDVLQSGNAPPPADAPASWQVSAPYAWFVVGVLFLANCVSYLDRTILSLLVKPIKAELQLSDTAVSLLQGLAFAVFYCGMGLVIARWADRWSRKWIVTTGIATWCAMTALSGTARSYGELFLYRVGVGTGEATLAPSAYSMIAGYFPPRRLSLAVGVFGAGITAGMGVAFLLGGSIIAWAAAQGAVQVPLLGTLEGWRLVFVVVGLLGMPVALLMLLVREPPRAPGFTPAQFADVWAHFRANASSYLLVCGGYGLTAITALAISAWTPEFYRRHYGATIPEAATLLGIIALVGGLLGAFAGGAVADRLESRGDRHAKVRVLLWCCIGLVPAGVLAPLMPTMHGAAAVSFFTFFFGAASTGPAGAFVQSITPDRMRAQFGAAYQLLLVLAGATLGPTAVALFTDFVYRDEAKIGLSLVSVAALSNPFAVLLVWLALRSAARRR